MNYGYVRVSTLEQNEMRQIVEMEKLGIPKRNLFTDKQSGSDFERKNYRKMLTRLKKGDLLYIKSIDRLGRNYAEIQDQWRHLTKNVQIDVAVIDMPILDTRIGKDLLGTFLSDVVLQVLSFVAENERINIRQRQTEGIAVAKDRGVKFGRPKLPIPDDFPDLIQKMDKGELKKEDVLKLCSMSESTLYRRIRELKHKKQPSKSIPFDGLSN